MRISDWSSDVCSSDLVDEHGALGLQRLHDVAVVHDLMADIDRGAIGLDRLRDDLDGPVDAGAEAARRGEQKGDRKSAVSGKSESVRVDPGGRGSIRNKTEIRTSQRQHT